MALRQALAMVLLAAACDGSDSSIRRAASLDRTEEAVRLYRARALRIRAEDPDAAGAIAAAVIERAVRSHLPEERASSFATLRALGPRARGIYEALEHDPGVAGDLAAASRFDLDARAGAPPRRLVAAWRSPDPQRRVAALAALEGRADVAAMISALGDVSPALRSAAASRLARWSAQPATTLALGRHAVADPDLGARLAAIYALGQHGPAASPDLERVLADPDETVRIAAIGVLGQAAPVRARALLAPMLAARPTAVALEAARVLASLGHRAAVGYVLAALESSSPQMRAQAAVAASALPEADAGTLAPHLEDADPEVRLRIASALAREGHYRSRIVRALGPLASRPDPHVAIRALGVLAELGEASAVPMLEGALRSPSPSIRRLAVYAWSRLARGAGAVGPLVPRLLDPDLGVRLAAAGEILRAGAE